MYDTPPCNETRPVQRIATNCNELQRIATNCNETSQMNIFENLALFLEKAIKGTTSPPSLPVLSQGRSHLAGDACGLTLVVAGKGFVTALNSWAGCYPKNPRFEPGHIFPTRAEPQKPIGFITSKNGLGECLGYPFCLYFIHNFIDTRIRPVKNEQVCEPRGFLKACLCSNSAVIFF
jgi:hypothetical protein